MLPLGALGVPVALFAQAPFFTPGFKLAILTSALLATALFVTGWRKRAHWAGKLANAAGAYLWCITGLVGFGPQ